MDPDVRESLSDVRTLGGGGSQRIRVLRVGGPGAGERADTVVVEEPLQVHLQHRGVTLLLGATMRTPGQDLDLAVGLAVGEGVVRSRQDVRGVRHCVGESATAMDNDVTIALDDDAEISAARLGRVQHPSSACGMCGRDEIDSLMQLLPGVRRDVTIAAAVLASLPDRMRERQAVFRRTGGLHAAALATAAGELVLVREDVGRHNAVDKVVGHAILTGLVGDVLVVSGRAGFEIVQKAAMAAIPVVAAVSAPTSLSVQAARDTGLTLAGFVRDGRMIVYSGQQRILVDPDAASVEAWA